MIKCLYSHFSSINFKVFYIKLVDVVGSKFELKFTHGIVHFIFLSEYYNRKYKTNLHNESQRFFMQFKKRK